MMRAFALRFAILLCCALAPLAIFAFLNPPNSQNLKEIAQRAANEYERLLQLRQQQVFSFAAFPSIRAFTASTPETRAQRASVALNELQSLVASDQNVRQAFIVDSTGTVILSTLDNWNDRLGNRQFVRQALEGKITVSPIARDRSENSINYAAPVLNNAGAIAGALVMRVAAQEFWSVLPRGENFYAVVSDENGVRLEDTGDPARRLASFGALDAARAARIVSEQTYGAEMPLVRATNLERAQQLITQGALDQLRAADVNADALGYQRLVSQPWTVLILASQATPPEMISRYLIPVLAAILLALGGAYLLMRV